MGHFFASRGLGLPAVGHSRVGHLWVTYLLLHADDDVGPSWGFLEPLGLEKAIFGRLKGHLEGLEITLGAWKVMLGEIWGGPIGACCRHHADLEGHLGDTSDFIRSA